MIILFNIVFQSGDFYNQDDSGFFKDLIITVLGSFFATISALLIYQWQVGKEKQKDKAREDENYNNTIGYFTSLLSGIYYAGIKQIADFETHAKNIKERPWGFHIMKMVIAEDLNRAIHKMPNDQLFYAYVNKFGNSKESITRFKKIISNLDYMKATYTTAMQCQEKHHNFILERGLTYKNLAEENVLTYCSLLSNEIRHTDLNFQTNEFYNAINSAVYNFRSQAPEGYGIPYMEENFIVPLRDVMVSDYRHIPFGVEIADNCRKAIWHYNETISKSEKHSEEFKGFANAIKKATDDLHIYGGNIIEKEEEKKG